MDKFRVGQTVRILSLKELLSLYEKTHDKDGYISLYNKDRREYSDGVFFNNSECLCNKTFVVDAITDGGGTYYQEVFISPWMCEAVIPTMIIDTLGSLKARLSWYEKAIAMECGEIPWDNHFDWPQCETEPRNAMAICEWRGAAHELSNTIDMLEAGLRNCE